MAPSLRVGANTGRSASQTPLECLVSKPPAVSPELRFYLRGENLNNDTTPDDYAYGKPGIGFYGGIKLNLR